MPYYYCGAGAALVAGLLVVGGCGATQERSAPPDAAPPTTSVIAHRGGAELWPENTLYAMKRARALGVDMLEMDVRVTREGVPVLMHDRTVNRTTDGSGPVAALTLEELAELDAGHRWLDPNDGTRPYRGQGLRVPTLDAVFAEFTDISLNIELKPAEGNLPEQVCELVREHDAEDRVLVSSFHDLPLWRFRTICPEVETSASVSEIRRFWWSTRGPFWRRAANESPAPVLQMPWRIRGIRISTARAIVAAQERGVDVHVWTVNRKDRMRWLLDKDVDGIITDRPDILLELQGRAPVTERTRHGYQLFGSNEFRTHRDPIISPIL